ncbi:Putative serine/threonine-protein kinase/receptor R818 [Rhizoctonia solani AG-1 IB]|uniref:Putative serine/threonine-protein kinase/receptor R818 n=1 Tax=Thanatephorus cucumeris (strain AG1-IB / isolate 7/3/14) TaxID=1108050 RepID=M5C7F6_THACB|nr:Putative serine/threonine-protein kinase/receptor R818 [Rhizoctonia solani AG-1 IB]
MGQSLGMVSAWMENGNLHEYLGKCPSANRYQLSLQVASGLAYIHSKDLVHGDIKALNVLVSFDGTAKLTDFGLSTMAGSSIGFSATSTAQAGSIRWVAPELLLEDSDKGKSSDVYALGMTILKACRKSLRERYRTTQSVHETSRCYWQYNKVFFLLVQQTNCQKMRKGTEHGTYLRSVGVGSPILDP